MEYCLNVYVYDFDNLRFSARCTYLDFDDICLCHLIKIFQHVHFLNILSKYNMTNYIFDF